MSGEFLNESEDKYLTDFEIRTLITNLSEANFFRLNQIAKRYILGCQMEPDDLLQEAIFSILSGNRKYPRNVPLISFFANTMKSIAYNERRKISEIITTINDDSDNDYINNIAANDNAFDIEAAANQEIKNIYDLFINDEDITMLLMAKYEELSPDETCKTLDWNRTQYDSVTRRLRRALNKYFPNGRKT